MRKIKFRAWDKIEKKMYTGLPYSNAKGNDDFITVLKHPQVYEVIQYTGLKDKNGKEIYEGDILKEENGDLDICLYLDAVASYGFVPIEIYMYNYKKYDENIDELSLVEEMFREYDTQCFPRNLTPRDFLEVIGNIYKNPELLKED